MKIPIERIDEYIDQYSDYNMVSVVLKELKARIVQDQKYNTAARPFKEQQFFVKVNGFNALIFETHRDGTIGIVQGIDQVNLKVKVYSLERTLIYPEKE